jgi:glyoxylate/hydroxypyruvate reductase
VSIATLAAHSDVLFVLAPQTPATYHIVSAEFLRLMKPSAVLVNAARGGLVDSDALAKALKEGQIFAAGLDVVEGEPNITKDHPLLQEPR